MSVATSPTAGHQQLQQQQMIHYDFPKVKGEIFMHAFCVLDAETVDIRSTMPSEFTYEQDSATFHSNTKLFGDDSFLTPVKDSIQTRRECKGGKYLQPSHEYYRPKKNRQQRFSYNDKVLGMDLLPIPGSDSVTVCAFVPDPHWGLLTGGWTESLRDVGFDVTGTFEDSGEMVWEVHCKRLSTTENPKNQSSEETEDDDNDTETIITPQTETPKANLTPRQIRRRQRLARPTMAPRPVSHEDQRIRRGFIY